MESRDFNAFVLHSTNFQIGLELPVIFPPRKTRQWFKLQPWNELTLLPNMYFLVALPESVLSSLWPSLKIH